MEWLYEGQWSVYAVLIACGLVFLFLARKQTQNDRELGAGRVWLVLLLVGVFFFLLVGAYWLMDRLVETRREQIGRRLNDMCVAVREKNVARIFTHFSDRFRTQQFDRAAFRAYVEKVSRDNIADDLVVWDVVFPDASGKVIFKAKPKSNRLPEGMHFIVRAEFVKEGDGRWLLQTFELFSPVVDTTTPLTIPQM